MPDRPMPDRPMPDRPLFDQPGDLPLSPRARRLSAGGSTSAWNIANEAMVRARRGDDILLLTLGDPDCPPHPAILEATRASLAAGRTHYTPLLGEPALVEAIAAREGCAAANVAVMPGAQHAGLAALTMVAAEGDEVILSDPYYATYPGVVAATGATAVLVPARADLTVDVAAIAAAVTPATRVIYLNSPGNPSGTALTAADFTALTALCRLHRLWLVVDEVYGAFRFQGDHVGAWQHGPAGQTIVIGSLSKSHAMTGYRIGWAIAPEQVVAALADWSAAALFGVSQFVQDAALAALALTPDDLADYRGGFARRACLVVDRTNAIAGLSAHMPSGGMFVMMNVRGVTDDDVEFAGRLLEHAGVAVIPGSGFGGGGSGHVRISLCPSAETLHRALDRIESLVTG